jgi:N,N'-diacetylchitobiose transport system substrate-binding protein
MAAMMQSILSGDATVEEATEVAAQEMNDVFASG